MSLWSSSRKYVLSLSCLRRSDTSDIQFLIFVSPMIPSCPPPHHLFVPKACILSALPHTQSVPMTQPNPSFHEIGDSLLCTLVLLVVASLECRGQASFKHVTLLQLLALSDLLNVMSLLFPLGTKQWMVFPKDSANKFIMIPKKVKMGVGKNAFHDPVDPW